MSEYLDEPRDLLAAVRTGDHLDRAQFPPLAWAVPGLIPEGFGLFTGAPKTGKSWAALGIALAVAAGSPALGKVATGAPRPVLLMALEDGERRLKGRCRVLLTDEEPIPANLHYLVSCPPLMVLPIIRQWLDAHGTEDPLIVLDTLGKVMPPAQPGEGAYSRDYRIGSALKATVDAWPGSTLLVVHHIRKLAGDDWMDSTSGTNGLNGAADFTLNLSRKRNEDNGLLRVTGRDVIEAEYAVTVTDGRWTLDGAELAEAAAKAEQARAAANLGDRSAQILAYVNSQSEPVTPRQVEDALNVTDARTYLGRLASDGRLNRIGRGSYSAVASVASVATVRGNATQATVATQCCGCGEPLDDVDGTGLHPGCEAGR